VDCSIISETAKTYVAPRCRLLDTLAKKIKLSKEEKCFGNVWFEEKSDHSQCYGLWADFKRVSNRRQTSLRLKSGGILGGKSRHMLACSKKNAFTSLRKFVRSRPTHTPNGSEKLSGQEKYRIRKGNYNEERLTEIHF
jgi:hypothetical protein